MPREMRTHATLRADPDHQVEERSFTHGGLTYIVRAELKGGLWAVAAYLNGFKSSREFELPTDSDRPAAPGVIDLLNELMIQAEDDVRKRGPSSRNGEEWE